MCSRIPFRNVHFLFFTEFSHVFFFFFSLTLENHFKDPICLHGKLIPIIDPWKSLQETLHHVTYFYAHFSHQPTNILGKLSFELLDFSFVFFSPATQEHTKKYSDWRFQIFALEISFDCAELIIQCEKLHHTQMNRKAGERDKSQWISQFHKRISLQTVLLVVIVWNIFHVTNFWIRTAWILWIKLI